MIVKNMQWMASLVRGEDNRPPTAETELTKTVVFNSAQLQLNDVQNSNYVVLAQLALTVQELSTNSKSAGCIDCLQGRFLDQNQNKTGRLADRRKTLHTKTSEGRRQRTTTRKLIFADPTCYQPPLLEAYCNSVTSFMMW